MISACFVTLFLGREGMALTWVPNFERMSPIDEMAVVILSVQWWASRRSRHPIMAAPLTGRAVNDVQFSTGSTPIQVTAPWPSLVGFW